MDGEKIFSAVIVGNMKKASYLCNNRETLLILQTPICINNFNMKKIK